MKKLFFAFALCLVCFFCTDSKAQSVAYYPGSFQVQVIDTAGREVCFIKYDSTAKEIILRGDIKIGLAYMAEVNLSVFELQAAAAKVAEQITPTGTVKNRSLLTSAMSYYLSIKKKWGWPQ